MGIDDDPLLHPYWLPEPGTDRRSANQEHLAANGTKTNRHRA